MWIYVNRIRVCCVDILRMLHSYTEVFWSFSMRYSFKKVKLQPSYYLLSGPTDYESFVGVKNVLSEDNLKTHMIGL